MPQRKVKSKICIECNRRKPIGSFYVKERRKTATRYFSRCKPCYYKWVYGRDKALGHKWHGDAQRNGPARRKLREAVEKGIIQKPSKYERCGKKIGNPKKLHGHHPDYRRPLDVEWQCDQCHRETHRP